MKPFLILTLYFLLPMLGLSQRWEAAGSENLSGSPVLKVRVTYSSHSVPYLIYADENNGFKAAISRFTEGKWSPIGNPVADSMVNDAKLLFDSNDIPWLLVSEGIFSPAIKVYRFTGTNWQILPEATFQNAGIFSISADIDRFNRIHLAYTDQKNNNRPSVAILGSQGWTNLPAITDHAASEVEVAIDSVGKQYVAYADLTLEGKLSVKSFDGNNWISLGQETISQNLVSSINIVINPTHQPVLAYLEQSNNLDEEIQRTGVVTEFKGGQWVIDGQGDFMPLNVDFFSLQLDPIGNPIVVYQDLEKNGLARAQVLKSGKWMSLGEGELSNSDAHQLSMGIHPSGKTMVAYVDGANEYGVTVRQMTLKESAAPAPGRVFAHTITAPKDLVEKIMGYAQSGSIYFNTDAPSLLGESFKIFNSQGQLMAKGTMKARNSVPANGWTKGIYMISVKNQVQRIVL